MEQADGLRRQVKRTYVGRLRGSRAFVALVIDGREALAYVCNGKRLAQWLGGRARGRRLRLDNPAGVRLRATYTRTTVRGVITLGGRRYRFSARLAHDGASGLLRGTEVIAGRSYGLGWIVDARRGVRGASKSGLDVESGLSHDLPGGGGATSPSPGSPDGQTASRTCDDIQSDFDQEQAFNDRLREEARKGKNVRLMLAASNRRLDELTKEGDELVGCLISP